MFLKRYMRWRYRRMNRVTSLLRRLVEAYRLIKRLSFDRYDYKTRIRYRLCLKSKDAEQLIRYTQRLQPLIKARARDVSNFNIVYQQPRWINIDDFLVDGEQRPYLEVEFIEQLTETLEPIVEDIEDILKNDTILYEYYEYALEYILLDWLECLDTLIAVELEIAHVERNASPSISRR